jgi:hypothetical protein
MRTLAPWLVSASLLAQAPSPKAPTFHLPAGDYSVAQLLLQAEQAVRSPIHVDSRDVAEVVPLRLQSALALPAEAWVDVLSALLATRGFVLVHDAANRRHEVLPTPVGTPPWLRERARSITLAELATRRALTGPVRVELKTATDPVMLTTVLRPHLHGSGRGVLIDRADGGGVEIIGLADTVRFAVEQASAIDPACAAELPVAAPLPWPRAAHAGRHEVPAGTYGVAAIVDHLAHATGRNIVLSPELAAPGGNTPNAFVLAAPIAGDAFACEDQLTALLWREKLLVVEVARDHGLYEIVRTGRRDLPPSTRCQAVHTDELLARPDWIGWVTIRVTAGDRSKEDLMLELRTAMAAFQDRGGSVSASTTHDGLVVNGVADAVGAFLRRLQPAAKAADPTGK